MEDYGDFLVYLNNSTAKLKELLEKITTLLNEAATCVVETASLFDPQIVMDLLEMAANGKKCDKYILEGEELKADLEKLLSRVEGTDEDCKEIVDELTSLEESLAVNFNIDIKKI